MYGWGVLRACGNDPGCWMGSAFEYLFMTDPVVAPPRVPSGAHGEVVLPPPGSGGGMTLPTDASQADEVVTEVANQQLRDQQALNSLAIADGGHWYWDVAASAANAGDAVANSLDWNWKLWAGVGVVALFGAVALADKGARRYGR